MAEKVTEKKTKTVEATTPVVEPEKDKKGLATASFVIGLISLCAWFIPCVGIPVTITGLVLGIMGLKSTNKTFAIIGIVLCSLGLIASIANAAWGAYLASTGQYDILNSY